MELKPDCSLTAASAGIQSWRECDISELCQLQRGFDITEATRKEGEIPVYSSSGPSYFHNEAKVLPPAVITGRKGLLGRVFFVEEPCWPHDTTLWVKDFKGNDPRFVAIFLSQFGLERLDAATSVPTLNRNNLVGIPIRLPSVPEQKVIAAALTDVDELLATLDRLIEKKRDIKLAARQQLLTGKTRLPGLTSKWQTVQLSGLLDFQNGVNADRAAYGFGVPFINVLEVITHPHIRSSHVSGRIRLSQTETARFSVRPGDIVFNRTSETQEEVGLAAVYLDETEVVFGGFVIRGRPKTTSLDSTYAGYALRAPLVRSQIVALGQGAIRANIGQADLAKVTVTLPPLPEQVAIGSVLSDLDAELAAVEQRRDKTRAIKQGMMQELLTGRTRLV